jgi:acyl-CoA reductase-like NAD-dependent aldehyde dehydrogenase
MSTGTQQVRTQAPEREQRTIPCHDPATGAALGEVRIDSPDDVRGAVARAREAQRSWAHTSFAQRCAVLQRILDHVLEHADELCEVICRDSGKTRENAMMGEIWPVCEKLRYTMAHGEAHLRPERRSSGLFPHKRATVHYQPLGVIGVITPWNYPLQNILGPTIPALMAGNGVVVKVSEWVAWSSGRFQRIFDEALRAEGLSTDLVHIVNGFGDTGAALVSSGVDKVIFTGSMGNGRKVIEESAKNVTPVLLELGGKDPLIVCADAHLEQAVHAAMAGAFIAAGQNCLAAERVLVLDAVYDDFVQSVKELARRLRQGPPFGNERVDVGAMTTPAQADIVELLIDDAVSKGARLLAGGKRHERHGGHYVEPTVLADVTPEMKIAHEETFGPVMCIMRVKDEEDAIEVANATQYGLGATVLTKSKRRAQRIVDRLVTGGASVNDFGLPYMAQDLPFGGVKGSGFGRLNGREGIRACTNVRSVLSDRLPLHVPAKLYPVGPFDYDVARSAFRLLYSRGLSRRLSAASELVRHVRAKAR